MLMFLLQVQALTDDLGREVLVERDRRRFPRVQDRWRHDRRRAPQEHHGGKEGRRGINLSLKESHRQETTQAKNGSLS